MVAERTWGSVEQRYPIDLSSTMGFHFFQKSWGLQKKRDFLWESEMTITDTSWKSVEQCDFKLGDNAIDDLGMGPKMTSFGSPYLGWILFGVNPTHNWIMTLPESGYEQVTQLFTSQLVLNWNIFFGDVSF